MFSADYEGKIFADGMLYYAARAKWKIIKTLWLIDDTVTNRTKSDLREVISKASDAVIMHSRLSHHDHAQLFEIIATGADDKQRTTVWVITEMTSHLTTGPQVITPGMLKVTLKSPGTSLFMIMFFEMLCRCFNFPLRKVSQNVSKIQTWRTA